MSEVRRYPALSEDMQARGLGAMLRIFGPGAIIASVTIGSGETVFASRGGAVFGYGLLWCFIGGGLMKFVQVYTAARYMTLTGEHPLERWKFLPGPQGWAVWVMAVLTVLCFPLWLSGLPKMLGGLTVWILGCEGLAIWGDPRVWGHGLCRLGHRHYYGPELWRAGEISDCSRRRPAALGPDGCRGRAAGLAGGVDRFRRADHAGL